MGTKTEIEIKIVTHVNIDTKTTHFLGASNPNDIGQIYLLTYCKALRKFDGVSKFSFVHH